MEGPDWTGPAAGPRCYPAVGTEAAGIEVCWVMGGGSVMYSGVGYDMSGVGCALCVQRPLRWLTHAH